jgi:hypothetical protein
MISPLKYARIRWVVAMSYGGFQEQALARREYMLAVRRAESQLAIKAFLKRAKIAAEGRINS